MNGILRIAPLALLGHVELVRPATAVYVRFGIRAPAVIEAAGAQLAPADSQER